MKTYFLDTSALLTLRDNEPGADEVEKILTDALQKRCACKASFMTQMELFYRVWKDEGEAEAKLAFEQSKTLPIEWLHEDEAMLTLAAKIKAENPLSIADAWIAAGAMLTRSILVHKDPEYKKISVKQMVLPEKSKKK